MDAIEKDNSLLRREAQRGDQREFEEGEIGLNTHQGIAKCDSFEITNCDFKSLGKLEVANCDLKFDRK